jgi:hypothetical protein
MPIRHPMGWPSSASTTPSIISCARHGYKRGGSRTRLRSATFDLIAANQHESCYIRPFATPEPVSVSIAAVRGQDPRYRHWLTYR